MTPRPSIYMTNIETGEESKEGVYGSTVNNAGSSSSYTPVDINYDYSSKTNIMLLALTDFCPYFCSSEDLNGKQLKDLHKREIMSPFNVHFNVTHMIELVRQGADGDEIQRHFADLCQPLIFKKYKKTEVSLDWTLLKLSFHDLQIFK